MPGSDKCHKDKIKQGKVGAILVSMTKEGHFEKVKFEQKHE